ncbi:purine permease 3-like [Ipomoea triloba]|uniref:purine permease 3-like n=1 Tax=Ipomoea triloba TaxID=35885 RepID=UPI00125D0D2D|nr:purine permease 3-like [Ipomoea triloba]
MKSNKEMEADDVSRRRRLRRALLVLSCTMLAVGNCAGPLIMRLYFIRGGNRIWLSSWLITAGWPVMPAILLISYLRRRSHNPEKAKPFLMKPGVFLASAAIGVLQGLDDYLYAYGEAKLPASTAGLVISTELAFTAGFSFILVKQKFTAHSVNAVYVLTMAAAVLAVRSNDDRWKGESTAEYVFGFAMMLAAAALYGAILPLIELMNKKVVKTAEISYTVVLEIQAVICFSATAFCTVGMLINKDFQAIPREAREFQLGEGKYYLVIACSAVVWQLFFVGAIGVIFCASSLFSGIVTTLLLPVTEILAVVFYKETFHAEKGIALALSLWGFFYYFYGEMAANRTKATAPETVDQMLIAQEA